MLGGFLFSLIPTPSSSLVNTFKSFKGFRTSNTMKIRLHVRATGDGGSRISKCAYGEKEFAYLPAMTCRPRPFPSLAPSIIPAVIFDNRDQYAAHNWGGQASLTKIENLNGGSVHLETSWYGGQRCEFVRGDFTLGSPVSYSQAKAIRQLRIVWRHGSGVTHVSLDL